MKATKNPYTFFDQFCLRTPLFSLATYTTLTKGTRIPDEQYQEIWKNPVFREAIFLASPELYAEVAKWMQGALTDTKSIDRLRTSFLKYIARITARCTPFGLFAGCSVGAFAMDTDIRIATATKHQRQTRFDMNFLVALSQELSKNTSLQKQLLWYPNNSLYRIGNQYRYVEYQYDKHNNREHSLEAVQHTSYLQQLIEHAANGATLESLAALLVDEEITLEDAREFVDQLVSNQILVSELEPSVTGAGFLQQISDTLCRLNDTASLQQNLTKFRDSLDQVDQTLGNDTARYESIGVQIKDLKLPFKEKYLFQTDVYPKLGSSKLHKQWGYRLTRLMSLLTKITPAPRESNMDRFVNAFTKRYETREIPLTTALDTEIGIGYLQHQDASDSAVFLEDLHIPIKKENPKTYPYTPLQEILEKKLKTLSAREYILTLHDSDFKDLTEQYNDLPDTLSAMTELVRVDSEEKMVISSIGGSSAANLLGRFTTGDTAMLSFVKQITTLEQQMNPDAILAEIVHLPQSRTGNVIRRASLRDYEIPYLGKSSLPEAQQIPIEDLMISVQYGQVRLRSVKHNKYVLPKLTNAHNYGANALPIYHFLCDLQTQKLRSGIGFYWGPSLERRAFLPRVCYKEFILHKARWVIKPETIQPLITERAEETLENIKKWRADLSIPQWTQLVDGDNTLLINLENQHCVMMLWETVKKRSAFTLQEFLFTETCMVTDSENKGFTNQMVIAFYNSSKVSSE